MSLAIILTAYRAYRLTHETKISQVKQMASLGVTIRARRGDWLIYFYIDMMAGDLIAPRTMLATAPILSRASQTKDEIEIVGDDLGEYSLVGWLF